MEVKQLTDEGIGHYFDLYNKLENNEINGINFNNFDDEIHIKNINSHIEIDKDIEFNDRFEMGKYLNNIFEDHVENIREYRTSIWSWIAILWFDKICPVINGSREIHAPEKYICFRPSNFRKYYRHLVSGPFEVYYIHKKYSRLMIKKDLDTVGDAMETLASRQDIISSKNIIKTADILYWDEENNKIKKGATNKKSGDLRRYVDIVRQLNRTYDLYSLNPERIIGLLPEEFDKWK